MAVKYLRHSFIEFMIVIWMKLLDAAAKIVVFDDMFKTNSSTGWSDYSVLPRKFTEIVSQRKNISTTLSGDFTRFDSLACSRTIYHKLVVPFLY